MPNPFPSDNVGSVGGVELPVVEFGKVINEALESPNPEFDAAIDETAELVKIILEKKMEEKKEAKELILPPNPYQKLVDAMRGRLESDIPMSDSYWTVKRQLQEGDVF